MQTKINERSEKNSSSTAGLFVEERQRQILVRLEAQGKVTVDELCQEFGVSAPTVRADLAALEARLLLQRTHGGALSAHTSRYEPPYNERAIEQSGEKRRIGQAAATLVQSGETIILDAGTTTHEVGLALAASGKNGITVVTNNLPTAALLLDAPQITTIVIGGQVQSHRRATLGPLAVEFLRPIRADRVFLGVSGVDTERGLTAADFDAVQVKRAMLESARSVVVVADATKVGQSAFAHIAPISVATLLITDKTLSDSARESLAVTGFTQIEVV